MTLVKIETKLLNLTTMISVRLESRDTRPTLNCPRRDTKVPSFVYLYPVEVHLFQCSPASAFVFNAALRFPHLRVFEFYQFILQSLTCSFSFGIHLGFFVVWVLSSHVSSYGCSSLNLRKPPSHLCLSVGFLL